MKTDTRLPVAIIGAGPVGLAAAAHLHERGEPFVVLEAGAVGDAVRQWRHVRMFSPWKFNIDRASERLLTAAGWTRPSPEAYPTGADVVERYLEPLARTPELMPFIKTGHRVTCVTRKGFDRMRTPGRTRAPFVVRALTTDGEVEILARAVIDASGTWASPNPAGGAGVPALGERAAAGRISTGIPDVLGQHGDRFRGKRTAVVGSGHSAMNVLLDLVRLGEQAPGTTIEWLVRKRDLRQVFGGGGNDQLEERGKLGTRVRDLIDAGRVVVSTAFTIDRFENRPDGVTLWSGERSVGPVDEVIVTTGFRPDLSGLSELRLRLDPITEAPVALAPLIDPNVHSCGTVPPHGAAQLAHDETDFYLVGMKSYGRAPTFLMMTGYEQVRSVVAKLAGDDAAAAKVELVLPETGVCSTDAGDCCGSNPAPAAEAASACCGSDCCAEPVAIGAGKKDCCDDTCCK